MHNDVLKGIPVLQNEMKIIYIVLLRAVANMWTKAVIV